jgi:plastocyanin
VLDTDLLREFLTAMFKSTVLFSAAALLFLTSTARAGNITGSVAFNGKAPDPKPIDMSADPKCKALVKDAKVSDVVTAGGKLAEVFVYVKNPPKKKYAPGPTVTMDQHNCAYSPRVFGVMVGQKFEIKNSDPTLHNVHAFAKRGEFNQAMPKQGQTITKEFKKEQVPTDIKCDVHSWMHAWAGVLEHPFFGTSGADGKFSIDTKDLPDGDYDVVAWHPTLGEKTGKVKVAGGNATVDFAY